MERKRSKLTDDMSAIKSAVSEILGSDDITIQVLKTKNRINTKNYMLIFQYPNEQIRRNVSYRARDLLSHLYNICEKQNVINRNIEEIAKSWGYKKSNAYTAMQELMKQRLILKRKDSSGNLYYFINPQIAWRGWLGHWQAALKNLPAEDQAKISVDARKIIHDKVIPIEKIDERIKNG